MRSRERIAVACCAVTVAFAGLAFGGAVRWAALGASFGAIASAIPFVTSRRTASTRSPLLILLAIALALTAIQLVPLPVGVADVVAHSKLELVTDNAQAWNEPSPSAVMASYDPPATLVELAKLAGYAALAFAALRLSSERTTRRVLAMIVVGATVAVALVTLAHEALGATTIYGVFVPPTKLVSPIINENHFSGLMAMAVPVALALAVTATSVARVMWLGASLLCTVSCLLVSSRGGAIGLVIGLIVTATLMLAQRRAQAAEGRKRRGISIPVLVVAACTVILVGALAAREVTSELSETRLEALTDSHWKIQTWEYALEMLGEHPWLGTGRGAFEPAYTQWAPVGDIAYSHAENTYVQIAVDWGIPGALAIGIAAIVIGIASARRWNQTPLDAAALGSLISLAAHDFVDFSLELPIVAMAAILLVAILLPARLEARSAKQRARWLRAALLTLAIAICTLAATPIGQLAHSTAANTATAADTTAQLTLATAAVDHHPADFLLMGRAAQTLMELGDPRAIAVISRALFLNPKHAGIHRLAATLLLRGQRPAQAQTEFALAVQFAPIGMLQDLVDEIAATFPNPVDAARCFPMDPNTSDRIADFIGPHKELAFEYTRRLAMLNPDDFRAQLLHGRAALATGHNDVALAAAREAFRLRPTATSAITLAKAQSLNGDVLGSITLLHGALANGLANSLDARVDLLTSIADIETASGAFGSAAEALEELSHIVTNRRARIALHLARAALHDRLGEPNLAQWERTQANKLQTGGGS